MQQRQAARLHIRFSAERDVEQRGGEDGLPSQVVEQCSVCRLLRRVDKLRKTGGE